MNTRNTSMIAAIPVTRVRAMKRLWIEIHYPKL
jgi:hypothetical protein